MASLQSNLELPAWLVYLTILTDLNDVFCHIETSLNDDLNDDLFAIETCYNILKPSISH